jgi:hypothetical protein
LNDDKHLNNFNKFNSHHHTVQQQQQQQQQKMPCMTYHRAAVT